MKNKILSLILATLLIAATSVVSFATDDHQPKSVRLIIPFDKIKIINTK